RLHHGADSSPKQRTGQSTAAQRTIALVAPVRSVAGCVARRGARSLQSFALPPSTNGATLGASGGRRRVRMSTCGRLFQVDKVYAYYVAADKHVVIVADVFQNPTADHVQICPNPIAIPPSREFVVIGTTDPGIHPQLVVKRRISTTFASDLTPRSVIVYTQGI